jgi:hypothetical protein
VLLLLRVLVVVLLLLPVLVGVRQAIAGLHRPVNNPSAAPAAPAPVPVACCCRCCSCVEHGHAGDCPRWQAGEEVAAGRPRRPRSPRCALATVCQSVCLSVSLPVPLPISLYAHHSSAPAMQQCSVLSTTTNVAPLMKDLWNSHVIVHCALEKLGFANPAKNPSIFCESTTQLRAQLVGELFTFT